MKLNTKQKEAFNKILSGENVFISGPGGVGKSFLVKHLMSHFEDSTVLLAPTGIAALNIGGATIHSTFNFSTEVLTSYHHKKIAENAASLFEVGGPVRRIVIDEISMVRADLFIAMDMNLRYIRRTNKPFGGLQVIVVGDFFQLPPVLTRNEEEKFKEVNHSEFAFATETWSSAAFNYIELDEVMRQTDLELIDNLQTIRWGKEEGLKKSIQYFNRLSNDNEETVSELDPVFLCTTNKTADMINFEHHEELEGENRIFTAKWDHDMKTFPAPIKLELKFGTKVMFLANTDDFKNGEIGYVTGFVGNKIEVTKDNHNEETVLVDIYEWRDAEYKNVDGVLKRLELGSFKQYPLKQAWAVTIHKSQGLTLPAAVIDFGRGCFTSGQAYVALSRVKNLDGIYLTRNLTKRDIIIAPEVKEFYDSGAKGIGLL